jgi:hypothetical protein
MSVDDLVKSPDALPVLSEGEAFHLAIGGAGKYIKFGGCYDSLFKYNDKEYTYTYSKIDNHYELVLIE